MKKEKETYLTNYLEVNFVLTRNISLLLEQYRGIPEIKF